MTMPIRSVVLPHRPLHALAAAAALLSMAPLAQAQAVPSNDTATGESSFELGRVTVTGRKPGPLASRSLLTSVDVLRASTVQSLTTEATWELFALSPGVMLTDFNQGTTSGKLSMRGFNGEGEVNAVKLLIDGTPSNSNDGNMPYLDMIFPLEIEAIEVVRGTNDARYGLHNIAGNVNLVTRQGGNETLARVGVGSFNALDLQLAKGVEDGAWAQNYFFGAKRSDGWRDHADTRKFTLGGKWFYTADGKHWRVGVTARHFEHKADEPGYLTQAQTDADPDQSPAFAAFDGGQRRTDQFSVQADGQPAGSDLSWTTQVYLNRLDDRRWVQFSAGVAQQERYTNESHVGARATLSWRPKVQALHEFALEGGVDTERQDNVSKRYLSAARVQTSQTRDQAWRFNITGAYVQSVLRPVPSLKIVPGFRIDKVSGDFDNRLAGASYAVNDYGTIQQPKISAVWTPIDGYAAYANWGRSFQVGVGVAAYKIPPRQTDLKASINDGWEFGLKFKPLPWLDGRVASWAQTASDEVKRNLNSPTGDSDNIGKTRRHGVDLQLAVHPTSTLDAWAAITRQKALIVEPDPTAPTTRGKEIDHAPQQVFNAGVDWQSTPDLKLSAWLQGQGSYYLERTNTTGKFGGYTVLNLGGVYELSPRWKLEGQLRNVTDRYTEYVWWDGTQSLHSRGTPRAFSLALSAAF